MARKEDKNIAISLRRRGWSYSRIKDELGISKSTLSGWLSDIPLSDKRVKELQHNEEVVEKIRKTKLKNRNLRLDSVYEKVSRDISLVSEREFFIAGFFLYWAEGGKTTKYNATLSNTDPALLRSFIKWLDVVGLSKKRMYARLHLYIDMDEKTEIEFWSRELKLEKNIFKKSYIKKSRLSDLTYITKGHGTCNIVIPGRDSTEYIMQGLKKIKSFY